MTLTQSYALAVVDLAATSDKALVIRNLCDGLKALGHPATETESLRAFLHREMHSRQEVVGAFEVEQRFVRSLDPAISRPCPRRTK